MVQYSILGRGRCTVWLISLMWIGILQNTAVRRIVDLVMEDNDSPLSSAQLCYLGEVTWLLWISFLHPPNKGESQIISKTFSNSNIIALMLFSIVRNSKGLETMNQGRRGRSLILYNSHCWSAYLDVALIALNCFCNGNTCSKYGWYADLMTLVNNMVPKNLQCKQMLCFLFQQLDQAALSLAVREDYLDNSTEAKSVSFTHSTLYLVRHFWVHKLFSHSQLFTRIEQCGCLMTIFPM